MIPNVWLLTIFGLASPHNCAPLQRRYQSLDREWNGCRASSDSDDVPANNSSSSVCNYIQLHTSSSSTASMRTFLINHGGRKRSLMNPVQATVRFSNVTRWPFKARGVLVPTTWPTNAWESVTRAVGCKAPDLFDQHKICLGRCKAHGCPNQMTKWQQYKACIAGSGSEALTSSHCGNRYASGASATIGTLDCWQHIDAVPLPDLRDRGTAMQHENAGTVAQHRFVLSTHRLLLPLA